MPPLPSAPAGYRELQPDDVVSPGDEYRSVSPLAGWVPVFKSEFGKEVRYCCDHGEYRYRRPLPAPVGDSVGEGYRQLARDVLSAGERYRTLTGLWVDALAPVSTAKDLLRVKDGVVTWVGDGYRSLAPSEFLQEGDEYFSIDVVLDPVAKTASVPLPMPMPEWRPFSGTFLEHGRPCRRYRGGPTIARRKKEPYPLPAGYRYLLVGETLVPGDLRFLNGSPWSEKDFLSPIGACVVRASGRHARQIGVAPEWRVLSSDEILQDGDCWGARVRVPVCSNRPEAISFSAGRTVGTARTRFAAALPGFDVPFGWRRIGVAAQVPPPADPDLPAKPKYRLLADTEILQKGDEFSTFDRGMDEEGWAMVPAGARDAYFFCLGKSVGAAKAELCGGDLLAARNSEARARRKI